jgi:DNA-binding transcriptional MocR family regulator
MKTFVVLPRVSKGFLGCSRRAGGAGSASTSIVSCSRTFSAAANAGANSSKDGTVSAAGRQGSGVYQRLKPGPLKKLYKYYTPGAVNFAGGVPMDSIFPIDRVTVGNESEEFQVTRSNHTLMLNYHRGNGIPVLRDWIQSHAESVHRRKGFDTCVSVGSTDAFAKVLTLLKGDTVLFDEYAYGAAVNASTALGRTNVGIKMDSDGMLPDELKKQTLLARSKGLRPDVVYLVPESQNPTGISMTQLRKREIYDVCKELDLIIIEDGEFGSSV